jgi:hypothetical protein
MPRMTPRSKGCTTIGRSTVTMRPGAVTMRSSSARLDQASPTAIMAPSG